MIKRLLLLLLALVTLSACGDFWDDDRTPAQKKADSRRWDAESRQRTQDLVRQSEQIRQNEKRKQEWLRSHGR